MRIPLGTLAALLLLVAGCNPKGTGGASGGPKAGSSQSGIAGKWEGKLEVEKAKDDDPAAKMAEAFASMMGHARLSVTDDMKFKLTMMGAPIEGAIKVTGDKVTLTPEKIAGMTPEEARKRSKEKGGTDDPAKPMDGTISADGSTLSFGSPGGEGKLVFKREVPKVVEKETVSASEKPLVGHYLVELDEAKVKAEEKEAAAAMKDSLELDLYADNTFKMEVIMKVEGSWKVANGTLTLTPSKTDDMGGNEPAQFKVNGSRLTPIATKGAQQMPFEFVKTQG